MNQIFDAIIEYIAKVYGCNVEILDRVDNYIYLWVEGHGCGLVLTDEYLMVGGVGGKWFLLCDPTTTIERIGDDLNRRFVDDDHMVMRPLRKHNRGDFNATPQEEWI